MRLLVSFMVLVLSLGVHDAYGQQVDPDAQPAAAQPWAMYGHDARHTGRTPLVGPQTSDVAWRRATSSEMHNVGVPSAPAVAADGTIYIAILGEKLLATSPDGTFKWAFQARGFISHLSPAIGGDGTVYIGATNGVLYAINPDGTQKWAFQAAGALGIPTIGRDGTIYVPSEGAGLYAVLPDGTEKWRFQGCTPEGVCNLGDEPAAVAFDGTIYLHSGGGCIDEPPLCVLSYFVALNPDGSMRWRVWTGFTGGFAPAVDVFGTIYFATNTGRLIAFRPNGTVKWAYDAASPTGGPSIGADGTVYLPAGGAIHALTPFGTRRWSVDTPQVVRHRIAIGGDGTIYAAGDFEDIYAFNADGTPKWLAKTTGTNPGGPAIGPDGRLYVGTGASIESVPHLYAFGTPTGGGD